MATIAERARSDLKAKIYHESKLSPGIKSIFSQMARDLKLQYSTYQALINAEDYEPELKAVMIQRARLVANDFKRSIRGSEKKDNADDKINAEMLVWIAQFVEEQIGYITITTDEQLKAMVIDIIRDLNKEGIPATKEAIAQRLSEKFMRVGMARSELIASEVVNTVAEKSKSVEAAILLSMFGEGGTKTWFTNRDGRERPTHHAAHGQVREMDAPFNVGSSSLMYPKDRSLGAKAKEIARCRCSAIYT